MHHHDSPAPSDQTPAEPVAEANMAAMRSVRRFDVGQSVTPETLDAVLRQARWAPSGYDLQPWRFLVVRSRRNRLRLQACAHGQRLLGEAPVVVILLGYTNPDHNGLGNILEHEVRRGTLSAGEAAYREGLIANAMRRLADRDLWAARSASTAATALVLAAASRGLSTAWVEGFDPEKVREGFGIPDDHVLCALIALGYGAEESPAPVRLEIDEICFAEHFGQPWRRETP